MPRVSRRAKLRREGITPAHITQLMTGCDFFHSAYGDFRREEVREGAMRDDWQELRNDLIAQCIAEQPGTRPAAFWMFDAERDDEAATQAEALHRLGLLLPGEDEDVEHLLRDPLGYYAEKCEDPKGQAVIAGLTADERREPFAGLTDAALCERYSDLRVADVKVHDWPSRLFCAGLQVLVAGEILRRGIRFGHWMDAEVAGAATLAHCWPPHPSRDGVPRSLWNSLACERPEAADLITREVIHV